MRSGLASLLVLLSYSGSAAAQAPPSPSGSAPPGLVVPPTPPALLVPSAPSATGPSAPRPLAPTATTAPPTGSPSPPDLFAEPAQTAHYDDARRLLLAGDLHGCVKSSAALGQVAKSDIERFIAKEQELLCADWLRRGFVLAHGSRVEEGSEGAGGQTRRTTGEMVSLTGSAVLFGLGTGLWFDSQTEPKTPAGAILPPLVLAGAAVGGVAVADSLGAFRYGVPQSIVVGLDVGFAEGLTWALWNQARTGRDSEWSGKTVATVIWGFSTGGAVLGGVLGSRYPTTPGRASYVGSTALWSGLVTGLFAGAFTADDTYRDDNALLTGALGVTAGTAVGLATAGTLSPSINRVRIIDLAGISGALVFGGLYFAAKGENVEERPALGVLGLGTAVGLGIATWATRQMRPDTLARETTAPAMRSPIASVTPSLLPIAHGLALGVSGTLF